MSTLVRNSGIVSTSIPRYNTRAALNLPDGSAVLVTNDPNSATADAGYGDATGTEKIYVYSSVDRVTWTLRNTINSPLSGAIRVTANVAADGTLGIACWTSTAMRYISVNTSTWVAASAQTPRTALTSPAAEDDYDLAFTDGNVPVIFTLQSTNTGSNRLQAMMYVRRTSDSTWIASTVVNNLETTSTPKTAYQALSGLVLLTGGSASSRYIAIAAGHGNGTTDDGVDVYTAKLDETTGAVTAVTKRRTYAVGEVPGSTTAVRARNVMLFPSDDNEYTLGIQHADGANTSGLTRGTYDGTTWTETIAFNSRGNRGDMSPVQYGMTMTYSSDRLGYVFANSTGDLYSVVAKIQTDDGSVDFGARRFFDNKSRVTSIYPLGGSGRFIEYPTHGILFVQKVSNTKQRICHQYVAPSRAPSGVTPANGTTVNTAEVTVRASADLDVAYPQSLIKMVWEFATDPAFTVNEFSYSQDDDKYILVEGTDVANVTVPVQDQLPVELALSVQGTWYVRAAQVDEYGVVGAYSAVSSFTVSHLPQPTNIDPTVGSVRVYSTGLFLHKWVFTDPWDDDHQTAYQIQVTNLDTATVVADTGKVASSTPSGTVSLPVGVIAANLQSSIALWDSSDVQGPFVSGGVWVTAYSPTVTINTPAAGATVNTAIPNLNFTVTFAGARKVVKYQVAITDRTTNKVVYTSSLITVSLSSGDNANYQPPIEILQNTSNYKFTLTVIDSWGLTNTATVNFSTSWTPPLSASGSGADIVPYNTENQGYVGVSWSSLSRDPDFTAWVVYRKMDQVDPNTGVVLEAGTWEDIYYEYATASTYLYKDYWAKSSYRVSYRVEQQVTRFGDLVSSSNGTVRVVTPVSDSYWVIDPDNIGAWKLGNVTSDSYNDEYEEAEFTVVGRGRHVDVGERIGYSGTLTAQLRDSPGLSARQKKQRLEGLKTTQNRKLYLRTPFGDVFRVAVRAMQVSRIAGVGMSEFVDVTIPYSEVSD